ncbi:MAG: GntR family transcriptional regulator [Herpetosiphon sp.]
MLKDKILRSELKPGQQIAVPEVALALGVSRTPVTDALKRLAGDGLVEIVPRQGTFVTQLTARDVAEIFEMRLMIELYAAKSIIEAGTVGQFLSTVDAAVLAMEQSIDGDQFSDYACFTANDRVFHTALVELTGNHRLIRSYTQLHVHTHGARVHYLDGDHALRAQQEHRAIIEAFKGGNVGQVQVALQLHIGIVKERTLDFLACRGGKL